MLLDAVKTYHDNVERDFYLKEISNRLDFPEKQVYEDFSKLRAKRIPVQTPIKKKEYSASEFAIGYILVNDHYREMLQE